MNESTKTLAQLKKASKLVRLAFRKNGPKSFKRGQGALLNALVENDGITQRELVCILGLNRGDLKDIVKKAARNGYVTIEDVNEPYLMQIGFLTRTPRGRCATAAAYLHLGYPVPSRLKDDGQLTLDGEGSIQ